MALEQVESGEALDLERERERNRRAYRRLKARIDQTYSAGQYIGIVRGKVVADAPTFSELLHKLASIEMHPDLRFVVQAGVDYPREVVIRHRSGV